MEGILGVSVDCKRRITGRSKGSSYSNKFGLLVSGVGRKGLGLSNFSERYYCISCNAGMVMDKRAPVREPGIMGLREGSLLQMCGVRDSLA